MAKKWDRDIDYEVCVTFAKKPHRIRIKQIQLTLLKVHRIFLKFCYYCKYAFEFNSSNCIHYHAICRFDTKLHKEDLVEEIQKFGQMNYAKKVKNMAWYEPYVEKDNDHLNDYLSRFEYPQILPIIIRNYKKEHQKLNENLIKLLKVICKKKVVKVNTNNNIDYYITDSLSSESDSES